jgi:hypothetical protein
MLDRRSTQSPSERQGGDAARPDCMVIEPEALAEQDLWIDGDLEMTQPSVRAMLPSS